MLLAWEALLAQARANRDTAEMMLIAMREARGCHDVPCQEDELQAWFHDGQRVAAIAQVPLDLASEVIDVPGFGDVVLGGGRELPHAPVRSNGAEDWEVIEDCFLDTDEDGPHTPPRRCGVECCSTHPRTAMFDAGCRAIDGNDGAINGEGGPLT